jgi:hypothetical protein
MMNRRWGVAASCLLLAAVPQAIGADSAADAARDAQALAARIDQYLAARWAAAKIEPAALSDDAEFLRRVYLDLTGKIPPVSEVRAFLADPAADKRQRLVEKLLDSPAYVTHFVNVWRALLLPEAANNFQVRNIVPTFENWLRRQLADNAGYDQLVRGILTASVGTNNGRMAVNPYGEGSDVTAIGFFMAKEAKPENLAASTARLFLGIRLECAQCHDHPTAAWKREQFWSYAAFFAGFQRQGPDGFVANLREIGDKRELTIPGKEQTVQATFLDGSEPQFQYKVPARTTLANWITTPENPYFARAGVNRLWAHFFGLGIIEPVDDLGPDHPPSHPELLDELCRQFVAHKFDMKFLIRAITASRGYQLSSTVTSPRQAEDGRLFARMAVKGLSPEQLFDSVMQATGYRDGTPVNQRALVAGGPRGDFLAKFASQESRTETHTSILQALYLMNGQFITNVTSPQRSELLAAVADSPFLDPAQKVETLFLATLSRKPRSDESERMVKYVNGGGAKKDPKVALGDVFWALLNSPEFILNH